MEKSNIIGTNSENKSAINLRQQTIDGELKGGMSADAVAKVMQKPVDNVTAVSVMEAIANDSDGLIRYSSRESLEQAVDALEQISDSDYLDAKEEYPFVLVMDHTPEVVLESMDGDNKVSNRRVIIRRDALYLAIRESGIQEGHYHGLGADVLKNLPKYLENPDVILKTDGSKNRRVVLTSIPAKKGQGVISVEFESIKDFDGKYEYFNVVVTVFDLHKNYLKGLFKKHMAEIKYKKEGLAQVNPQLYEWLRIFNAEPSTGTITQSEPEVKNQNRFEAKSARTELADAFEPLVKTPTERKLLKDYRENIAGIEAEEAKLRSLNGQIKELSFAKGKRDTAKLRDLKIEAKKTANRINIYDQRLLRMEAMAPLKAVMEQQKES